MYQLHWTFRMIQRNISDKPRITQLWYSRWSFFSWHETDGFVALWSFVQALLRHFLPKNGFIVGIQENSSSSNSPAIQFTPESPNCDSFFSWNLTDRFIEFWSFVQALLQHFLLKNSFIFGIQENSSTLAEWLFEIKFLCFWFDFTFFDNNSSAYHTENSYEGEILTKGFILFICPLW